MTCQFCGADCTNGRSWDGGDLYACTTCANWRAQLNAARARIDRLTDELDRLRAIEDRANRAIAHMPPDSEWVMAARLILDGHCGRRAPLND